jgi:hypothetical protein
MNPTPLFDHLFEQGESSIPSVVVKRRAIKTQTVAPARASDPETSVQAANANQEIRGAQRIRVYEYLKSVGPRGATDFEIGTALSILRTSAGKRRRELQDMGHVEDSGTRRQTDTGSTGIVWRIKRTDK